jgi:small subunit ribosomal protein S1
MGQDESRRDGDSFAEMLEASMSGRRLVPVGEKVQGTVVSIGREYVFLDLGSRAEGLLPVSDVTVDGKVTVAKGDRLTVLATAVRDGAVMCALRLGTSPSHDQKSEKGAALDALREARDAGVAVDGTVKEVIKGGFSVTVLGFRAFCPISQIQRGYCDTPEEHVGRTYSFLLVELDPTGRNIVVSRRKLLDAEAEERAASLWQTLEEGAVMSGTVSSLRSYGAFVDLGGVEGLLHVSEIAHERIEDPKDLLTEGQMVQVVIKDIDRERRRISLSLKALTEDHWLTAAERIAEGQLRKGSVSRLARFGAFVELEKGVEGLLHVSELGQGRRVVTPREVLREGQEVVVRVLSVDLERRRISLTLADEDEDRAAAAEAMESLRAQAAVKGGKGLGTLGDLMGPALKRK